MGVVRAILSGILSLVLSVLLLPSILYAGITVALLSIVLLVYIIDPIIHLSGDIGAIVVILVTAFPPIAFVVIVEVFLGGFLYLVIRKVLYFDFGVGSKDLIFSVLRIWSVPLALFLVFIVAFHFIYIQPVLTENKEAIEYCHEEAASGGGATTAANIGLAFGCGMYNVYEKAVPSLVFLFLMLPNNPVFFITGAHLVRKYLE